VENYTEKRRHPRVSFQAKVALKAADTLDENEAGDPLKEEINADSADISITGVQIVSKVLLPPGRMLRLEITMPEEAIPVITFGRVEWCFSDSKNEGVWKSGVNFELLHPDHTKLLKKLTGEH